MEHGRSKNQPQAELIGVGVTPQTNGSLLYTALEHAAHGEKMNVQTRLLLSWWYTPFMFQFMPRLSSPS